MEFIIHFVALVVIELPKPDICLLTATPLVTFTVVNGRTTGDMDRAQ